MSICPTNASGLAVSDGDTNRLRDYIRKRKLLLVHPWSIFGLDCFVFCSIIMIDSSKERGLLDCSMNVQCVYW